MHLKALRFLVPVLLVAAGCGTKPAPEQGQRLFIGDDIAITQTQYGTVQGYILDDVYTYLGIPYGAPTGGANRFLPPQEPQKWEGVRPALFYGNDAPQGHDNKWRNNAGTFTDHWNYYDYSEDCLNLNVWTPAPDGSKRPVLVWMHGGGFSSGNSIEQDGYNGANLAREGNVVFVSVNHRFGVVEVVAVGRHFTHHCCAGVLGCIVEFGHAATESVGIALGVATAKYRYGLALKSGLLEYLYTVIPVVLHFSCSPGGGAENQNVVFVDNVGRQILHVDYPVILHTELLAYLFCQALACSC